MVPERTAHLRHTSLGGESEYSALQYKRRGTPKSEKVCGANLKLCAAWNRANDHLRVGGAD